MMHRTFLSWTRPALPAAADHLVEAHLSGVEAPGAPSGRVEALHVADLSRATVVVPGARAGRRLTELLLEEAERRAASLLPPRVVTVGGLASLLSTSPHPPAPDAVRRLTWSRALREADRRDLSAVFARLPARDEPLLAWRGLAAEVADLARTVAAGGLTFDDVARRCGEPGIGFDDGARWRVLARVQTDYRRLLEGLGFGDPELERMAALRDGRVRLPGSVWLVAVAELPPVLTSMLRAAARAAEARPPSTRRTDGEASAPRLHALVHAPAEERDAFDELGLLLPERWTRCRPPLDDARISVVEGPGEQAAEAIRVLASSSDPSRTDEVVVGVPQPEVVPYLAERLAQAGIQGREAAGTPASRSGPWRLLAALGEVLRERSPESVAALLRHPDLTPWLRERTGAGSDTILAALDRWRSAHLPSRMVAPYPGAQRTGRRGGDARLVAEVMTHVDEELLRDLSARRPLSGHAPGVVRVLDAVYRLHPPERDAPTRARIAEALRLLDEAAGALGRLPPELDVVCDGGSALALLLDECARHRIPPEPSEGAIELLGWLELHLDDTRAAVVTGVNEGALPETVRADPFLPDGLRRHLGLEDNHRRLARDLYRLSAMLHSRDRVHLVAGRRTADGDPLRPSRLLFAADDDTVARRVRRFYGVDPVARTTGDGTGEEPGAAAPGARGSDFVLPPEPVLALDPFPATLSATDFRGILDDGYRWALKKLRGAGGAGWPPLEPVDDAPAELDGAAFGELAHTVLERFGQEELKRHSRGEAGTDPGPPARRLDELLDEVAHLRFGRAPRVAVRLQIEQLRTRLRAFARWHAGWVADGWRICAIEARTPREGVPLGSSPPVGVRGTIDRIDRHPERGWAVLDYKTADAGEDPTRTHVVGGGRGVAGEETQWRDLQLPLYRWLAPRIPGLAITGADEAQIAVGYILLPRETEAVGLALAEWDAATLDAGVATARRLVAELAAGPVRHDRDARPRYREDARVAALLGRGVLGAEDEGGGDAS